MSDTTRSTNILTADLRLEFVGPESESQSLDGSLRFDPADPYAVTTVFGTGKHSVSWTFARDLLIEGIYEPTGDGDVHLWPCLSATGAAVLMIELCSGQGDALLQAPSIEVHRFIEAMLAAVPLGQEEGHLDLDSELERFLSELA